MQEANDPLRHGKWVGGECGREALPVEGMVSAAAPSIWASWPIAMVWQPVRDVRSNGAILYQEGLVRFLDADGGEASPQGRLEMIQSCGGGLAFDRMIVRRVLQLLNVDPLAVLGVNISARSADADGWQDVLELLQADRSLAGRLIVEITETEPFAEVAKAAVFCAHLRACGVRVALDDFGAGHTSVATAMTLTPAIIKIDGRFVREAVETPSATELFRHLVGTAHALGALTVVEGVETKEQADLARDAGCPWQQGYFHGRPSATRRAENRRQFIEGLDVACRILQADMYQGVRSIRTPSR